MKKTLKISLITAGAAMLFALPAFAQVDGQCNDCHTMHNSVGGQPVAVTKLGAGGSLSITPYASLLLTDCAGCHMAGGVAKLEPIGGGFSPQVYHTDSADLAGGNFAYIDGIKGTGASDRKGHNVVDIVAADGLLTGPPGMGRGATQTSLHTASVAVPAATFTCAGNDGCHGTRNQLISATVVDPSTGITTAPEVKRQGLAAMGGTHHYNIDGVIDASTSGSDAATGFRFIWGLYGLENPDAAHPWENFDAASHNEYYGQDGSPFTGSCEDCHDGSGHGDTTTTHMTAANHTISGFCGGCHGTFHLTQDTAGAFIRHPSDYALPGDGEYAAYTTYDLSAPIARATVPSSSSATVTPGGGEDIVMCLSCHMAHASDNDGMLRFDYTTMVAGAGANTTGCFVCHSTKDTNTP
jgi:hypothetical protein